VRYRGNNTERTLKKEDYIKDKNIIYKIKQPEKERKDLYYLFYK